MTILETVYNGRDNSVDLLLKADGAAQNLSFVTRMVVMDKAGAWTVDSSTAPTAFDWTTGTTGKVELSFGGQSITVGTYVCYLIVYDASHTNGINWGEFVLEVI